MCVSKLIYTLSLIASRSQKDLARQDWSRLISPPSYVSLKCSWVLMGLQFIFPSNITHCGSLLHEVKVFLFIFETLDSRFLSMRPSKHLNILEYVALSETYWRLNTKPGKVSCWDAPISYTISGILDSFFFTNIK